MENKRQIKISKFLSLILRHKPEVAGISLDENGWVNIDSLLDGMASCKRRISREELMEIVESNDKRRFAISPDGEMIRASQGHSVSVDLGYQPVTPPAVLFHGTAQRNIDSIKNNGIRKKARHHVHLSKDEATAARVGQRHGKLALMRVNSARMHEDGYSFFESENGVWLTDYVPVEYIELLE